MNTINIFKKLICTKALNCILFIVLLFFYFYFTASLAFGDSNMKPNAGMHEPHHHSNKNREPGKADKAVKGISIPDVEVYDQNGKKFHFYTDLVKDKVVAIQPIFTTCTTVCPIMAATFSQIQNVSGTQVGKDFNLISISIDPLTDTPDRLKAMGAKFGAKPGWTLVTGSKLNIDKLLRALNMFAASKEDHSPIVLIGNEAKDNWTRANGLASPGKLTELINGMISASPSKTQRPVENLSAKKYFTDVVLVNQNGENMRFYSDLLKGKVAVIHTLFTTCSEACPVITQKVVEIQKALGDRLGKDVHLISLSVDPLTDTPKRLKDYADKLEAKPGWYFLTGKKENMDFALQKLGQFVENKETHMNIILIGNDRTGLWKKLFSMAKVEELIKIVEGVLNDKG